MNVDFQALSEEQIARLLLAKASEMGDEAMSIHTARLLASLLADEAASGAGGAGGAGGIGAGGVGAGGAGGAGGVGAGLDLAEQLLDAADALLRAGRLSDDL